MGSARVVLVCLVAFSCVALSAAREGPTALDYKAIDKQAVAALQTRYISRNGLWDSTLWWQCANALNALVDYSLYTQSSNYTAQIQNTYRYNQRFNQEGIDDEGWWGLAWTRAYILTKDKNYLNIAIAIWQDMVKYYDTKCNGGVWWDRARTYKNAVTNELFFELSAALYLETNQSDYLTWAQREWAWIEASGMINSQSLINDGINTNNCQNNGQTTWTYNQGVVLGGLVNLWKATKNNTLLTVGLTIAKATFQHLVYADGVLREPCEPSKNCNNDQDQFKGIFMRHLGYLYDATKDATVGQFIAHNVDSLWNRARSPNNDIGTYWEGPFDVASGARQSSAVEAINAALLL